MSILNGTCLSFLVHGLDDEGHPDEGVREQEHRQQVRRDWAQHYLHRHDLNEEGRDFKAPFLRLQLLA